MSNDMDGIINLIDDLLNRDISYNLDHFEYDIFQYVDGTLFDFDENAELSKETNNLRYDFSKITEHLEGSKVLRYDFEHDATIIEIIGGYLIIKIDEVFNYINVQMCYCRHNIAIPRTLCFIGA